MIYFLIPVFNEESNIPRLAEELSQSLPGEEKFFVLVDDCSTDATLEQVRRSFAPYSFHLLEKTANRGPGDSFNQGFRWILGRPRGQGDLVVTMEGDNTADLATLPEMMTISRLGYDLVLASVYAQGGSLGHTNLFRKVISLVANALLRAAFDLRVATLTSFYRTYRLELLESILDRYAELIEEPGFISMTEILIKAIRVGGRIIEVPTRLRSENRVGGSKMKVVATFLAYCRFLRRSLQPESPRGGTGSR